MTVKQLTRHSHGPAITAKGDGKCRICRKPIRAKIDFIAEVDKGVGWMHFQCAKNYCDILDEHLPEDEGGE